MASSWLQAIEARGSKPDIIQRARLEMQVLPATQFQRSGEIIHGDEARLVGY
jgi:hypothetical protein